MFGYFLTLEARYALAALSAYAMAAAETALYLGWRWGGQSGLARADLQAVFSGSINQNNTLPSP